MTLIQVVPRKQKKLYQLSARVHNQQPIEQHDEAWKFPEENLDNSIPIEPVKDPEIVKDPIALKPKREVKHVDDYILVYPVPRRTGN